MSNLAKQFADWFSGARSEPEASEPDPVYAPSEMTSFFASLTKDQQERALSYRGDESHGEDGMRTD